MNCNITIIVIVVVTMLFVLNYDILTNSVQELINKNGIITQKQIVKEGILKEISEIENKAVLDVNNNLELEMARLDRQNQQTSNNTENVDELTDESTDDSADEPSSEPEPFMDYVSAHTIEADPRKTTDPDCPFISFYQTDKDYFCASSDTFYGCANATSGSGVSPYDAAYGVVGGYLGSLPETSPAKMRKCAMGHRNVIRNWNLCEGNRLAEKKQYSTDIKNRKAVDRFLKVDYSDNVKIVDALNYAC